MLTCHQVVRRFSLPLDFKLSLFRDKRYHGLMLNNSFSLSPKMQFLNKAAKHPQMAWVVLSAQSLKANLSSLSMWHCIGPLPSTHGAQGSILSTTNKTEERGLERQLTGQKHCLLCPRTHAQSPAPAAAYSCLDSRSRGAKALF